MFAVSSTLIGGLVLAASLMAAFGLLHLALQSPLSLPAKGCQVCEDEDDRPALEHDRNCPYRLSFFGGQPEWDREELQTRDGVVYFFDEVVGSWRPQLWDHVESHRFLE